jgi:Ser/Thr protein kinase RdoA (MazF antagonist)
VAAIHRAWAVKPVVQAYCTGVIRRLQKLSDWRPINTFEPAARRATELLTRHVEPAVAALRRVAVVEVPLQPCLCDVWHDHVLFAGDAVTGIIDYAAARVDSVVADLARLLGSMIPGEPERVTRALDAYAAVADLPPDAARWVNLLDWTGTVAAAANWLQWLDRESQPDNRALAIRRLEVLVRRLELPAEMRISPTSP